MECVAERDKQAVSKDDTVPPAKRQKLSKSEKKKLRGQNKSRGPTFRRNIEIDLCNTLIALTEGESAKECNKQNCQFLHDIDEYLKIKPKDLGKL